MSGESDPRPDGGEPWPQRLLDDVWLLAVAALAFWLLSYVVWGLVDLLGVPGG